MKSLSLDLDTERRNHEKTKNDLQSRDSQIQHLNQRVQDLLSKNK
jgi:hypothetical protein